MAQNQRILQAAEIEGVLATKNYIRNYTATFGTAGWATYKDADQATPEDGTAGSAGLTFTQTTISPIRGSASFVLDTVSATSRRGEGVSYDFTIDSADKAKVLSISFEYEFNVTQATGDWTVWIYDVTNAALIQPAGYQVQGGVSGTLYKHIATFQTASNSTSYRLLIHRAVNTATDVEFKIDSVVVSPQIVQYGAPVTDWDSFTPTGTWIGGTTTYSGRWRRVGDSMQIQYRLDISGTPTSTTLRLNLPSGYAIDTAKLAAGTGANNSLTASDGRIVAAGTPYPGRAVYNSTTQMTVYTLPGAGSTNNWSPVTHLVPGTFVSGDIVEINATVPIAGWSSTVQMSNDTDTRVVAAKYTATPTGSIGGGAFNTITYPTKQFDTHGSYSGGTYTVPVSGVYSVSASVEVSGTEILDQNVNIAAFVNGSAAAYLGMVRAPGSTTSLVAGGSHLLSLNAGDLLTIRVYTNIGTPSYVTTEIIPSFSIHRLSGPSAIAATETVAFAAQTDSGAAIGTGNTDVVYDDILKNSHGAYNSSNGVFTAPIAGFYAFHYRVSTPAVTLSTSERIIAVLTDGSNNELDFARQNGNGASTSYSISGSCIRYLNAGAQVKVRARSSVATTLDTGATYASKFEGTRIGN